jgi:hypothetical protein
MIRGPALADVIVIRPRDPAELPRLQRRLEADPQFDRCWRPADGWLAGARHLPGPAPQIPADNDVGVVVVEGPSWCSGLAALEAARSSLEHPERLASLGRFRFRQRHSRRPCVRRAVMRGPRAPVLVVPS